MLINKICINGAGSHNVLNSLAAISVACLLKIDIETIKSALSGFLGVKRRFTNVGELNGIKFIDDYAHHPTEIESILESAKQVSDEKNKKIIICQPHKFSRLQRLFKEFVDTLRKFDTVVIMPVYRADDSEIGPIDSTDLYTELKKTMNEKVDYCEDENELLRLIKEKINKMEISSGDVVLFAGAGSISKIAYSTFDALKRS
jgi:UDP-N-acetylmuramate--alanine ligase